MSLTFGNVPTSAHKRGRGMRRTVDPSAESCAHSLCGDWRVAAARAMRRLIRNIEGEPRPLILHRRLHRLRVIDQYVRYRACMMLGLQYRRPRYLNAQRTLEQEADLMLACESFIGVRSPDPRVARYYFEIGRWILLASPNVSDERKRRFAGRKAPVLARRHGSHEGPSRIRPCRRQSRCRGGSARPIGSGSQGCLGTARHRGQRYGTPDPQRGPLGVAQRRGGEHIPAVLHMAVPLYTFTGRLRKPIL